jgi:hypothetical protein
MSNEPMIYRPVKVRAIIEYEIPMWDAWQGKEQIEAYLNEYTRCTNHIIEELQELIEIPEGEEYAQRFCLCGTAKYQYLGEVEEKVDTDG